MAAEAGVAEAAVVVEAGGPTGGGGGGGATGGGGGATSAGTFAFTFICFTGGAEPEPATPAGTEPVLVPVVFDALLFVELPRKNAAAKAAAPMATAMKMIRAVLLIPKAGL